MFLVPVFLYVLSSRELVKHPFLLLGERKVYHSEGHAALFFPRVMIILKIHYVLQFALNL